MRKPRFLSSLLAFLFLCGFTTAEKNTLKDQFSYSFNDIQGNLVVVEHDRGVGSGFIAKMGGRHYIFTNQHVILGAKKIQFKTVSGKTLKPKRVELSMTRDIARLLLDTDSGLEVSSSPKTGIPIGVFGNSDGAGVATELYGKVTSVSSDLIEISADFVLGNSGSPVLNTDKEVLGIASFLRFSNDKKKKDDDEPDTITRRFCYRLTDLEWKAVNWKKYNENYGFFFVENDALTDEIFEVIWSWFSNPFTKVSTENLPDSDLIKWAKNHNQVVSRIERISNTRITQHKLDNTNKQIRKDLIDSANVLSAVCAKRERQMRLFSSQKELTGFMQDKFLRLSKRLGNASKQLDGFAEDLQGLNYFSFN